MEKLFVAWSLIAVILSYSGIILGAYSNKRTWKLAATAGQVLGGAGLIAILLYLLIK